ncbi:MAG: histidinol-phosphate transaminase [bacterium]
MKGAAPASASVGAHGGPHGESDARLAVRIDCSTSVNAYGPAHGVVEAIERCITPALIERFPDPQCWAARHAVASACDVLPEQVVVGAGAAELIQAISIALVATGDTVLVPTLAFSEYARAARICGGRVVVPDGSAEGAMEMSPDETAHAYCQAVERERPVVAFLCSPENPLGRAWTLAQLRRVSEVCRATGTLLVLDQAYDAFTASPIGTPALSCDDHVIHLRSLTKDHALAGVRVAYAIANPRIAQVVEDVRVPWAVSTAAQAAIIATFHHDACEHVHRTTAFLRQTAHTLSAACTGAGLAVHATDTHYFVAAVPGRFDGAADYRRALLVRDGIKVRDCGTFGLPRHVRIAARTETESDIVLRAIQTLSHE